MSILCENLTPINLEKQVGFNLNETEQEWVYDVRKYSTCSVQVIAQETWATAVLTLGRSNSGKNYRTLETPETLGPGSDMSSTIDCTGFGYLHVKCTTVEGSDKYADVFVLGKAGE